MSYSILSSGNSRYIFCDIKDFYELASLGDQIRCFVNDKTLFKIAGHELHLFFDANVTLLSLGQPVTGVPHDDITCRSEKFYLKDFGKYQIYRFNVGELNLSKTTPEDLICLISEKRDEIISNEKCLIRYIRIIIRDQGFFKIKKEEKLLLVDFLLD